MTTPHHQDELPAPETQDATGMLSRRLLLRRSMLGIAGAVAVPLLVACGGEEADEEDAEEAVDEVNNPPDAPEVDPDDPGMDAPNDDIEDDGAEEDEGD